MVLLGFWDLGLRSFDGVIRLCITEFWKAGGPRGLQTLYSHRDLCRAYRVIGL